MKGAVGASWLYHVVSILSIYSEQWSAKEFQGYKNYMIDLNVPIILCFIDPMDGVCS